MLGTLPTTWTVWKDREKGLSEHKNTSPLSECCITEIRPVTRVWGPRVLAKHNVTKLPQPPYSHDLAAGDFFLFPKIETTFKGRNFDCIETVQAALTTALSDIHDEAFAARAELGEKKHRSSCALHSGKYFEPILLINLINIIYISRLSGRTLFISFEINFVNVCFGVPVVDDTRPV